MENARNLAHSHYTLIHYFLSYFLPLSFLLLSFFLIVRSQLTRLYFNELNKQADQQLEHVTKQFTDDLMSINRINSSLTKNINLILSRHTNDSWIQYLAFQEIESNSIGNNLIDSIVYHDKVHNTVLSSGKYVYFDDSIFYIHNGKKSIPFSLEEYSDSITNQLIYITNNDSSYLLYYPCSDPNQKYDIFYIINRQEVQKMLHLLASREISCIALLSPDEQIAVGINSSLLIPYLSSFDYQKGKNQIDSQTSILSCSGIYSGFTIVALISNKALISQVNITFSRTYLLLALLGIASILFIFFAMKQTYLPLRKLTQKLVQEPNHRQGYLEQLDSVFTTTIKENQNLQEKINKYKLSMQKSILDSIISNNQSAIQNDFDYIEPFFTMEPDNLIFALHIKVLSPDTVTPFQEIAHFFNEALPEDDSCIILEAGSDNATLLLNYSGLEPNKEEAIHALLNTLHEEKGYFFALSNGSPSPMDIPSLYENALLACNSWEQAPVVSYNTIVPSLSVKGSFSYPYEKLDKLAHSLNNHLFDDSRVQIQELFELINNSSSLRNALPDFFVRCVLIDILTVLINSMNQANIKFKTYSDIYFEALYFCRSCPYKEKQQEIQTHIEQLLTLYESEAENNIINRSQIQQFVNANYTSADFSISLMADTFHVSIAYMSYLFKKETGENFSDYVWALRLEKAKELLLTTNMPIDEISIAVGYINTSSFRRKFKQETGITPSQLRTGN